jgi:hypothetical protein
MQIHLRPAARMAAVCAVLLTGLGAMPAQASAPAQAPKPPTNAKKIVQPVKSGQFVINSQGGEFVQAATTARDFDLAFSVINPTTPRFFVGAQFRAVSLVRWYALVLTSDGEAAMLISRDLGQLTEVKPLKNIESWKRNAGEKNDIALYVRGGQALLFINKKFADEWDVGEINDFGNMWIFGDGPEGASGTIDYKAWTVKVPANAIPPEASATSNRNIVLSMYRSGYQRWGRPAGFDNPRAGCSSFDDGRPVLQFQAVMKVTNNNKIPMKRWAPLATTRSGRLAFGCALGYDRSPLIEPGGSADITVEYYIEPGDAITAITVIDLENGRSNKMNTPAP